jgi:hypothetical protein
MSVRCSQGHDNPDGSAFCDECGEPLAAPAPTMAATIPAAAPPIGALMTCPSCGSTNPAGESFCSNCGANLSAPPAAQPVMAAAPAAPAAPAPAAPPLGLQPRVVVESDNTTIDIAGKTEVLIGREDAVSNIFPDIDLTPHNGEEGGVGRRHARILYSGGQYMIEDLSSINFTFLNKQKLTPKTPTVLRDGDEIRLGRVVLRFKTA